MTTPLFTVLMLIGLTASAAVAPAAKTDVRATKLGEITGFAVGEYEALRDLTVDEFLDLKPKEFARMTGERLKFKDRIIFSVVKKNMRKAVRKAEKYKDYDFNTPQEVRKSFNWGAFFLGLFLALIGVIISFFFRDKNAWKSALIGLAVAVAIALIISFI